MIGVHEINVICVKHILLECIMMKIFLRSVNYYNRYVSGSWIHFYNSWKVLCMLYVVVLGFNKTENVGAAIWVDFHIFDILFWLIQQFAEHIFFRFQFFPKNFKRFTSVVFREKEYTLFLEYLLTFPLYRLNFLIEKIGNYIKNKN